MKATSAIVILSFMVNSAWSSPHSVPKRPIAQIPGPGKDGVPNMAFFRSFNSIANKSPKCQDGMDPRWKAKLYISNMKKITTDLPVLVAVNASDLTDQNLLQMGLDLKSQVKALKTGGNSLISIATTVLSVSGPAVITARTVLDGINWGLTMLKKIQAEDPTDFEATDLGHQMKRIRRDRDELVRNFQELRHGYEDIENALKGNKDDISGLSKEKQELMRSIMCQFTRREESQYDDFCGKKYGDDFFYKRGSFGCKDVTSTDSEHHDVLYKTIKAAFANGLAKRVVFKDPSDTMADGTTARFEVTIGDKKGRFRAPGGHQLLCTILNDPAYEAHWNKKPRQLKPTLKIRDMGFPVLFRVKQNKVTGNGDFYYQAEPKKGLFAGKTQWEVGFAKFGSFKPTRVHDGTNVINKLGEAKNNPSVSQIVGTECDD